MAKKTKKPIAVDTDALIVNCHARADRKRRTAWLLSGTGILIALVTLFSAARQIDRTIDLHAGTSEGISERIHAGYDAAIDKMIWMIPREIASNPDKTDSLNTLSNDLAAQRLRLHSMSNPDLLDFNLIEWTQQNWKGITDDILFFLYSEDAKDLKIIAEAQIDAPKEEYKLSLSRVLTGVAEEQSKRIVALILSVGGGLFAACGTLAWFFFRQAQHQEAIAQSVELAKSRLPEEMKWLLEVLLRNQPVLDTLPTLEKPG